MPADWSRAGSGDSLSGEKCRRRLFAHVTWSPKGLFDQWLAHLAPRDKDVAERLAVGTVHGEAPESGAHHDRALVNSASGSFGKCQDQTVTELAEPDDASMRKCLSCGGSMEGKRSIALTCSVACNQERLAERRRAEKWAGIDPNRPCAECGASLAGKRPHAKYCSRKCKTAASNARLRDAGVLRDRDRARYAKEADKRREYARQYLRDNPERMRAIRLRRRNRIKGSSYEFTERDWQRLLVRYRGCCAYCGERSGDLQREHVVPLVRGGVHSVGNIVPACQACNYSKKDKLLTEWRFGKRRSRARSV